MFERYKWQICIQQEEPKVSVERKYRKNKGAWDAWDQKTEIGIAEDSVEEVFIEEITGATKEMKLEKHLDFQR